MMAKRPLSWFLLSYVAVLLIPIVLGLLLYVTAVRTAEEDSRSHNTALLRLVRETVDSRLRETVQLSRRIAENPRLASFATVGQPLDTGERLLEWRVLEELRGFKDIASAVDDFYLYLPGADIVLTPTSSYDSGLYFHSIPKYRPLTREEWIASITDPARRRRFVPSETGSAILPYLGAIAYIQPLPIDYLREPTAFLVMLVDTGTIIGYLEEAGLQDGTVLSVTDESDRTILSTGTGTGTRIGYADMPEETGTSMMRGPGERRIAFYTTSRETSWKYAAIVPERVFLERARYITNTAAAVFASCLVLGLLAAAILAWRSYRPYRAALNENREMRGLVMENSRTIVNTLLLQLLRDTKGKGGLILRSLERYGCRLAPEGLRIAALRTVLRDPAVARLENPGTGRPLTRVVEWDERILAVFLDGGGGARPEDFLRDLVGSLRAQGDGEAVAGLGPACGHVDDLRLSFREALQALTSADAEAAVAVARTDRATDHSYEYSLETEGRFMNAMRSADPRKAEAIVESVFEENLRHRKLNEGLLRCLMFDLASGIIKVREETGLFRPDADQADPVIGLVSAVTFREFKTGLLQAIRETCETCGLRKTSHNERLRDELLAYIDGVYTDNLLSVSSIADHFHLSPAYLSHFFKEQTGTHLLDHINRRRVARVKELLSDRSLTLSKVAVLAGFSNDIVLNRVFKKYTGFTPGRYRSGPA